MRRARSRCGALTSCAVTLPTATRRGCWWCGTSAPATAVDRGGSRCRGRKWCGCWTRYRRSTARRHLSAATTGRNSSRWWCEESGTCHALRGPGITLAARDRAELQLSAVRRVAIVGDLRAAGGSEAAGRPVAAPQSSAFPEGAWQADRRGLRGDVPGAAAAPARRACLRRGITGLGGAGTKNNSQKGWTDESVRSVPSRRWTLPWPAPRQPS